nr:matrix metalloproteinase 17-1 [Nemopilema nomurai]
MDKIPFKVIFGISLVLRSFQFAMATPVNARTDVTADTMDFLEMFGYLQKPDPRAGKLLSQEDIVEAVKKVQQFAGLPPTGLVDSETSKLLKTPRCGMSDIGRSDSAKRKRRYNAQGTVWNKQKITWRVENFGNDGLSPERVKMVFENALGKWSGVTNIEFEEIKTGEPDIWFRFVRGAHGDPYPFRTPGSTVLAHAFYPFDSRTPLSGDVHFNDDKVFTIESPSGKDLLWISVHELGHSIGLDHSDVKSSIMYPYYRGYPGLDFELTPDDVRGAQALYGEKTATTPKIPAVTIKPYDARCFSKMGAVFLGNDKRTYVFNSDKLYILKTTLGIDKGPILVSDVFIGALSVDAAFKRQSDRSTIIFSGKSYYVYSSDYDFVSGPAPISDGFLGFPANFGDIDAAFVWPGNNLMYIFKGSDYWRVYQRGNMYRAASGYPRKISSAWIGIPDNIDAVTTWANGVTYFFKGSKYYRLNQNLHVEPGYPKNITRAWIRSGECQSSSGRVVDGGQQTNGAKSVVHVTTVSLMMSLLGSVLQVSR